MESQQTENGTDRVDGDETQEGIVNVSGDQQVNAQSRKHRQRWWTLAVLSMSLVLIAVDTTILNVAIPALQRGLGASASGLQWIVSSYILVFAGLLLTMGFMGDRFGRKLSRLVRAQRRFPLYRHARLLALRTTRDVGDL